MTDLLPIAQAYFAVHSEQRIHVIRADYAYHRNHRQAGAHYYAGSQREAPCRWCGRTREEVRWEDASHECANRPQWADESIESVIQREEILFGRVQERARAIAATLDLATTTGEDLATLHHTHGVDPSMLEAVGLALPQSLHDAYQVAYASHRETGKRGGVKREILVAKTLGNPVSPGATATKPL